MSYHILIMPVQHWKDTEGALRYQGHAWVHCGAKVMPGCTEVPAVGHVLPCSSLYATHSMHTSLSHNHIHGTQPSLPACLAHLPHPPALPTPAVKV